MTKTSDFLDSFPDWLRWIILVPCSIIFYCLCLAISLKIYNIVMFHIIPFFSPRDYDVSNTETIIFILVGHVFSSIVAGASYIYSCNLIAPYHQKQASIILLIIFLIGLGYFLYNNFLIESIKYNFKLVDEIFGTIGVCISYFGLYSPLNKRKTN